MALSEGDEGPDTDVRMISTGGKTALEIYEFSFDYD